MKRISKRLSYLELLTVLSVGYFLPLAAQTGSGSVSPSKVLAALPDLVLQDQDGRKVHFTGT